LGGQRETLAVSVEQGFAGRAAGVFELRGCCLWNSLSQFHKHAIYPARALVLRVFIRLSMDTPGSAKSVPGLSSCAFQSGSGWRSFTKFSGLERYGADLRRWPWIAAHSRVANKLVQHAAMALPGCFVGRLVLGWVCSFGRLRLTSVQETQDGVLAFPELYVPRRCSERVDRWKSPEMGEFFRGRCSDALYQGTTLVGPLKAHQSLGFSPCMRTGIYKFSPAALSKLAD
jgi:hypothetical protein